MEPWVVLERQEGCEEQSGPRKNLRARYHCRVGDREALPPAKHYSQISCPPRPGRFPVPQASLGAHASSACFLLSQGEASEPPGRDRTVQRSWPVRATLRALL